MKPLRKHLALAIDGGGIRGVIVTRALTMLEEALKTPLHQVVQLSAGTSTGSIISAGIASGIDAQQLHRLYVTLGSQVFQKTWRYYLWPLTSYRYSLAPLENLLLSYVGNRVMGDLWEAEQQIDVVITTFDLVENRPRFIKPWKPEYSRLPVVQAVLSSSSVPTYFPVVSGRFVDGGVGSYANPCYLAAYEAVFCLGWDPAETTLISLGTGRDPHTLKTGDADRFWTWQWLSPVLDAFLQSAADQQVHLVHTFFKDLDFRRFQINTPQAFGMDDPANVAQLEQLGEEMGHMILNDQTDPILDMTPPKMLDIQKV